MFIIIIVNQTKRSRDLRCRNVFRSASSTLHKSDVFQHPGVFYREVYSHNALAFIIISLSVTAKPGNDHILKQFQVLIRVGVFDFDRTDGQTDGRTDGQTDVDRNTVRMHLQSHGQNGLIKCRRT